jgi:pyruvate formate lyase activating enzyme
VDLFQLDLKHMDSERHRSLTGAGNERVHESAAFLLARGANVELRMPLVPGVNDDAAHLARVARFLERHGVRALSLVPYHRLYEGKYVSLGLSARLSGTPAASPEDVRRASALLRREGVAVSVAG